MAVAGSGKGPGAGRLLAGSIESPELVSSLAFRLPEALDPLPAGALRLTAGTAGLFFFIIASRSSLNMAGETWKEEIALRKASSSCLSITLRQAHPKSCSFRSSRKALLSTGSRPSAEAAQSVARSSC